MDSLFFVKCLLKPSYLLRKQLLLSLGVTSFLTVIFVVIAAWLFASKARDVFNDYADQLVQEQLIHRVLYNDRSVADALSMQMQSLEGGVQILTEIVKDRIVGYPQPGWEDDVYVPFFDTETSTNKYPLKSTPLPLDWEYTSNINTSNAYEHLQEREYLMEKFPSLYTAHGIYFMQGVCDPNERNPYGSKYYPNCTAASNNVTTGGVVHPTATNEGLYEKSADIAILMKPLFESHPEVSSVAVYYANSGAGSYVTYPGYARNSTVGPTLMSAGCEWMRTTNPYTGKPYGTEEEIARCRPSGSLIPPREYNALERLWCQSLALNPFDVGWHGPYYIWDNLVPLAVVGRSIFDVMSGHFIGCSAFAIDMQEFRKFLMNAKIHNDTVYSIVRFHDGSIFGDTIGTNPAPDQPLTKVNETDLMSNERFQTLRNCVAANYFNISSAANQSTNTECFVFDLGVLYTANGVLWSEHGHGLQPEFLLIHRINTSVLDVSGTVNEQIDEEVLRIWILALAVGVSGFALVILIIWLVARKLTQPLIWMERVSREIVNHKDKTIINLEAVAKNIEPTAPHRFTPHTELDDVVKEFRKLIHGFSGHGASTIAIPDIYEVRNELIWQSDFHELYSASGDEETDRQTAMATTREKVDDPRTYQTPRVFDNIPTDTKMLKPVVPALPKCNFDKNVLSTVQEIDSQNFVEGRITDSYQVKIRKSLLFWWLLVLIVLPLLLSIAGICFIVSRRTMAMIPDLIDVVKTHSEDLESLTLHKIVVLKAGEVARALESVVRDLHIVTRLAGWLFFNGVNRSDSFTFVNEITDQCKIYPGVSCPVFDSSDIIVPCTCEQQGLNKEQCSNYSSYEIRQRLTRFFYAEARDFDPLTGDRSYVPPKMNDSPEQTKWWHNFSDMPGAEKGSNASGYETTYDRVRVSSAMAVVEIPVFSYASEIKLTKFSPAFIAFEADGMGTGFPGCVKEYSVIPQFKSTSANGAAEINPDVCPLGKYGYDPRCRDWYASGKELFHSESLPVLVTAPFKLAVGQQYGTSITSPVANPFGNSYVGQTMLQFDLSYIQKRFESVEGMSFLITSELYTVVNDTVDSPYSNAPFQSGNILDLLFLHDGSNSTHRTSFENEILHKMKNGTSGDGTFNRTNEDGIVETFSLIYEPVRTRVLLPLRPDDYSRGVNVTRVLVYSLGIAHPQTSVAAPWQAIADDVEDDIGRLRVIYYCIVVVVTVIFVFFTVKISVNITRSIVTLLRVVENINRGKHDSGIPPMQGGSKEVLQVYNSLTKLYKIIRGSNFAFFSGKLAWAYDFVCEALALFRRVGDEKAIGIACSNVGSTLQAMCLNEITPEEGCVIPDFDTAVQKALEHYDESIQIAESLLEQCLDAELKAYFTQQLSDRLFNRALLLCLAYSAGGAPKYLKEKCFGDIKRVRELDSEVRTFLLEQKLLLEKSSDYFFRLCQRCLGLLQYYEELKEIWDPEELVQAADQFLFSAWNEPSAQLFKGVTRIGRLQQLESVAIQLELLKGKKHDAARLAIRMFVEDEYLLEEAFRSAASALLSLFRDPDECPYPLAPRTKLSFESDLRKMLKSCRHVKIDIGKCLVFAIQIKGVCGNQDLLERINANCLQLFDNCCTEDDYVGVAAYTTNGDLNLSLGIKSENEGLQRSNIDLATTSTCEIQHSSLPYATQMLIDSNASSENDSFILIILDGASWDSSTGTSFLQAIEKLNNERYTKVHVIILGIDLQEGEILEQCKRICTVSAISKYMDITLDNIDYVFESVANLIGGEGGASVLQRGGIIMEKF